jgi:hypothetical protein
MRLTDYDYALLDVAVDVTRQVEAVHRGYVERLVTHGFARWVAPSQRCYVATPKGFV